jgi:putative oxidoreductase
MSSGILLLRVVFGLALAAHGSQELFGWLGGHGPRGTAGFFGRLGFRVPLAMAALAGPASLRSVVHLKGRNGGRNGWRSTTAGVTV